MTLAASTTTLPGARAGPWPSAAGAAGRASGRPSPLGAEPNAQTRPNPARPPASTTRRSRGRPATTVAGETASAPPVAGGSTTRMLAAAPVPGAPTGVRPRAPSTPSAPRGSAPARAPLVRSTRARARAARRRARPPRGSSRAERTPSPRRGCQEPSDRGGGIDQRRSLPSRATVRVSPSSSIRPAVPVSSAQFRLTSAAQVRKTSAAAPGNVSATVAVSSTGQSVCRRVSSRAAIEVGRFPIHRGTT